MTVFVAAALIVLGLCGLLGGLLVALLETRR